MPSEKDQELYIEGPLYDFLDTLPQRLENEIEKCRNGQDFEYKLEFCVHNNFMTIPEDSPAYKKILEYCQSPDVNMKGGIEFIKYRVVINLGQPFLPEDTASPSLHKKYCEALHERKNNILYSKFDTLPELIKQKKAAIQADPRAYGGIQFSVPMSYNDLPDYEAYHALHEYCRRPEVNVCVYRDNDSNYRVDYCNVLVHLPYSDSRDIDMIPLDIGRKLPELAAPTAAPDEKKSFWKKLGF